MVVGVFFLLRVLMPLQAGETFDTTSFMSSAEKLDFQTRDGRTHTGWYFPGMRGAPVIVLCHGYRSSRVELLTLATSLQQHRYNVFDFNFAGHGDSPVGYTTLGYRESEELLAALEMLATRTDIDTKRMGLWGNSLGAYAALGAAAEFPAVKAVVVDSAYPHPTDMLQRELHRIGADAIPGLRFVITLQFRVFALFQQGLPAPPDALPRLMGTHKLFIAAGDAPELGQLTRELYQKSSPPKELAEVPRAQLPGLSDDERRDYENLVVSFYLRNLPLVATGR